MCRNFPDFYYYKEFSFAGGKRTFGIIFIDTVLLCGNSEDDDLQQPSGPVNQKVADAQWKFIEEHLKSSK